MNWAFVVYIVAGVIGFVLFLSIAGILNPVYIADYLAGFIR